MDPRANVQNLDSAYRLATEDRPITVRPYMITANDLAEIGHARCHGAYTELCDSDTPEWLVSGWASCTEHLVYTIQDAARFNEDHGIWHD